MSDVILQMSNITKRFSGVTVLNKVNFNLRRGEVHVLIGENGAGKSTLMKILTGIHQKDEGRILLMDQEGELKEAELDSPVTALEKGISMVFQEFNLMENMTIAENICIGYEPVKGIVLDRKKMMQTAREQMRRVNMEDVSPTAVVETLTTAQKQCVEIAKCLSHDAKIIILDEPTSSLSEKEVVTLFSLIRSLKASGVSIVYISHRMEEIFEICDTVSIFRDGTYVGTRAMGEVSREDLISMMVGRKVGNVFPKTDCEIGDVVFRAEGLTGKGFTDISFEVHAGEILGFSGLVGSGRSETMRAIFGLDPLESGKLYLEGKEIKIKDPYEAVKLGIAMVNEDRKDFGLCLHRSIRENISLPNLPKHQKGLFLNQSRERKEGEEVSKKLTVKAASIESEAYSLSGGNQQKVVLSKWIMANPKVLILDEPTRGVDVGAKSEIHALMCQFAAQGMAIIMISSELPEVMGMSDRLLIYHEGRINGEILREEILSGTVDQKVILEKEFGGK